MSTGKELSQVGLPEKITNLMFDRTNGICLIFVNAKSDNWFLVRELCLKTAECIEHGKALAAFFSKNDKKSMVILREVVRLSRNWVGFSIFIDRIGYDSWQVYNWLDCYVKSELFTNITEYCIVPIRNFKEFRGIIPCRLIADKYSINYGINSSNFKLNVKSVAVNQGVIHCPNFCIDYARLCDE